MDEALAGQHCQMWLWEVWASASCICFIPSQRLHYIEQYPGDMEDPSIYEIISIPYTFICPSPIQLQARLVRPGNFYPFINSLMAMLVGPGKTYSFVSCSQQQYMYEPSALKALISDDLLNSSHSYTSWCPSIEVCNNLGSFTYLFCLKILVNDWCSCSFNVFIWPHQYQIFGVLPDSQYSQYTHERITLKNPNFITTSEILCLIFCAPTITPCWKSSKSW